MSMFYDKNDSFDEHNLESATSLINQQLLVNKASLSLSIDSVDFRFENEIDRANCLRLVNGLLNEVLGREKICSQQQSEIDRLFGENQKLFKKLGEHEESVKSGRRAKNIADANFLKLEKSSEANQKIFEAKIKCLTKENAILKSRENMYEHTAKRSESEKRSMQERLSARLDKQAPDKFCFCINSDKAISEFRAENISLRAEKLKAVEKSHLAQMSEVERENDVLKKRLFHYKDCLIAAVMAFKEEMTEFCKNEGGGCVVFDLSEDYSALPFSAFSDLFDEAITSSFEFLKTKFGRNPPPALINSKNIIMSEETKPRAPVSTISKNQLKSVKVKQELKDSEKGNLRKLRAARLELELMAQRQLEARGEKMRIDRMAHTLERENLQIKREREELETEKNFWLAQFEDQAEKNK